MGMFSVIIIGLIVGIFFAALFGFSFYGCMAGAGCYYLGIMSKDAVIGGAARGR